MRKIDKGVPIPAMKTGREPTYPFAMMEIGDSFLCDLETTQHGISATLSKAGKRLSMKFQSRMLGSGNVRVWRTA